MEQRNALTSNQCEKVNITEQADSKMEGKADGGKKDSELSEDKHSNLKVDKPDAVEKMLEKLTGDTMDEEKVEPIQEVNGDFKNEKSPTSKGKTKKAKLDENAIVFSPKEKKGPKRLFSESIDEAEESMEFVGFESQENIHPGLMIIKKLLAEAESSVIVSTKRIRRPTVKVLENADMKDVHFDSDENKLNFDEAETFFGGQKIKKDKNIESDRSETESIGLPHNIEFEFEKREESISGNSSVTSSPPITTSRRGRRPSVQSAASASPRQREKVDIKNPIYKKPFEYGWKRELVIRGTFDQSQGKRQADIYYFPPNQYANRKKVRSMKELAEYLKEEKITNVTTENFTYCKEPIGMDEPMEVVRNARSQYQVGAPTSGRPSLSTKSTTVATASTSSTAVSTASSTSAVSSIASSIKTSTPIQKKVAVKKIPPKRGIKETMPSTSTDTLSNPPSPKVKIKDNQGDMTPVMKPKVVGKKESTKKDMKKAQKIEETKMLPPQQGSPMTRRSQQAQQSQAQPLEPESSTQEQQQAQSQIQLSVSAQEKVTSKPGKRPKRRSVQEPCSIRCSANDPSVQCSICLCLYHAECVDFSEEDAGDNFVCKNCKDDTKETCTSLASTLTPPPLIPISLLGSSQNTRYKQQQGMKSLPKLQRIPRNTSNNELQLKSSRNQKTSINSKANEQKNANDYFNAHEVMSSLPAQNLAVMNGRKYIVIPKDNAMAVQPAITAKQDKNRERLSLPMIRDSANLESSMIEESISANTERNKNYEENEKMPNENLDMISSGLDVNEITDTNKGQDITDKKGVKRKESFGEEEYFEENDFTNNHEISKANLEIAQKAGRKRQIQIETDQRQHSMANACVCYHALSRIFQYLKVQELLRAGRVCRMWHDLAAQPSLWRTVRMKNSQVTDWDGFAEALNRYQTQHLDLRKMLLADGVSEKMWAKFVEVIPKIMSLRKLELCRCPGNVVEAVIQNCPQLECFSAMLIKCDVIDLSAISEFKRCTELRLKASTGMALASNITAIQELKQLIHLSLTSVKELGKRNIEVVGSLINLEVLELGECSDFPETFGTEIIAKLPKLERLRLEKGQGTCCTFNILEGVTKSANLTQLELVNFDIKRGFDTWLAKCTNIKKLLIIPTYISQSATSNHMILGGVTHLKDTLTHFVWGVTLELLRVTELFVDQCKELRKRIKGDAIPILKPIPCADLIEDILKDAVKNAENPELAEMERTDDQSNSENLPEVDILTLLQLQKLLLLALPKTRVKILKIPFHATWRQSISDSAMQ